MDGGRTASELSVYSVLGEPEMPVERILAQEYSNLSRDRQGSLANRMAGNRSLTVADRICGTIGDTEAMTWRSAVVLLGVGWLAAQNAPPVRVIRQLPARRVARRVIGGAAVGATESSRELISQERYRDAARIAEEAVSARPENSDGWYALALASAASGNTNRSLEALEQAAAKGWTAWERMEAEPLLAKVRRDPRYAEILARMRR